MAFELNEEGLYRGVVKSWGLKTAGTGNPQWVITVEVNGRAKDDDDLSKGFKDLKKPLKRTIFNVITPKTVDRVLEDAVSLGFKSDNPLDLDPKFGPNPHDFEGVVCNLQCEHDEYKGKSRERWRIARRAAQKELTDDMKQSLQALYGDIFKDKQNPQSAEEFFDQKAKENENSY